MLGPGVRSNLAMQGELRVLWSPEYLSRLWCVLWRIFGGDANPNKRWFPIV